MNNQQLEMLTAALNTPVLEGLPWVCLIAGALAGFLIGGVLKYGQETLLGWMSQLAMAAIVGILTMISGYYLMAQGQENKSEWATETAIFLLDRTTELQIQKDANGQAELIGRQKAVMAKGNAVTTTTRGEIPVEKVVRPAREVRLNPEQTGKVLDVLKMTP